METDHTRAEQRLLDAALKSPAVVLDAGCGRTTRLRDYRDRITPLVGVDVDADAGRAESLPRRVRPRGSRRSPALRRADVRSRLRELRRGAPCAVRTGHSPNGTASCGPAAHWFSSRATGRTRSWRSAIGSPSGCGSPSSGAAAGVAERDVYPARYLANTPKALERAVRSAGFEPVSVEYVGTLHRYGARVPGAATILRPIEAALPDARRRRTGGVLAACSDRVRPANRPFRFGYPRPGRASPPPRRAHRARLRPRPVAARRCRSRPSSSRE